MHWLTLLTLGSPSATSNGTEFLAPYSSLCPQVASQSLH